MKKTLLFILWFLCLMVVWNFCSGWVSAPNTFLLALGWVVAVAFMVISVKTKCFTHKWGK